MAKGTNESGAASGAPLHPVTPMPPELIAKLMQTDVREVPGMRRMARVRVRTSSAGYPFGGRVIGFIPEDGTEVDPIFGVKCGWWEGEIFEEDLPKLEALVEKATPEEIAIVMDDHERALAEVAEDDADGEKYRRPYRPSVPAVYRDRLSRPRKARELSPILEVVRI